MKAHAKFKKAIDAISGVVLDKEVQIKLSLSCLIAQGHLLIEDLPGMGKTTLAQCLARALGLQYERVQFTSDLLPGDVLGASIYDQQKTTFSFHQGPVFTQVLLADEINRSTPKTQSALLEAMEEKQVTVDGQTRVLPKPFFVIATQNPLSQAGTYPLPESQLDRFLMCISLGFPSKEAERQLLSGGNPRESLSQMLAVLEADELISAQEYVHQVKASDQLIDYIQRLVDQTRTSEQFPNGLSPRGSMALLKAAKAWAFIHGRDYVLPEDVQAVLPSVVEHRVQGYSSGQIHNPEGKDSLSQLLIQSVEVIER